MRSAIPFGLFGMEVIVDVNCYKTINEQVRFPRSKKKRIRKKWCKDRRNWVFEKTPLCYQMGNKIICAPEVMGQIRAACAEVNHA